MPFGPIENYGVIGNMQSIGLVGMNGSIDFLCYPNFDSPTIFAALLDDQNGGRFEMCCKPRFSYASCGHQLELSEVWATFRPFSNDCPPMALHSTVRLGRQD